MVLHAIGHVAERQLKLAKESREFEAKHFNNNDALKPTRNLLTRQSGSRWSLTTKVMSGVKGRSGLKRQTSRLHLLPKGDEERTPTRKTPLQQTSPKRHEQPHAEKTVETKKTQENEENSSVTATNTSFDEHEGDPHRDELPKGIEEYVLKKRMHGGSVGGMHWQEDPTGQTWLHHGFHWPRDFATIRGKVIEHKGEKWLLATQVRQVGKKTWHTAPQGAALPFAYGQRYRLVPHETVRSGTQSKLRAVTTQHHTDIHESISEEDIVKDDVCLIFPGTTFHGILHIKQCRCDKEDFEPVHSTLSNSARKRHTFAQFLKEKHNHQRSEHHHDDQHSSATHDLLMYFLDRTRSSTEPSADVNESSSASNESALLVHRASVWFPDATLIGGSENGFKRWCDHRPAWQIMEIMEFLDGALEDLRHSRRMLTLETVHSHTMVAQVSAPRGWHSSHVGASPVAGQDSRATKAGAGK